MSRSRKYTYMEEQEEYILSGAGGIHTSRSRRYMYLDEQEEYI